MVITLIIITVLFSKNFYVDCLEMQPNGVIKTENICVNTTTSNGV